MIVELEMAGRARRVDLSAGIALGIPIGEDGRHPRFFVDGPARFSPLEVGGFCGRVQHGGSCNADRIDFVPHCHGTHTEGAGHVLPGRQAVDAELNQALIPASLITVRPEAGETGRSPCIRDSALQWPASSRALIIRTLPNGADKRERDYAKAPPYPLLEPEAVARMAASGIDHLLIDTPSLDGSDEEQLLRHRLFWGLDPESSSPSLPEARRSATVTEMIFVPDHAADGDYLLHLGLSNLVGDATPSCPILYPMT
ncbi:cyclase family protein [Wenzhouxiangella marina]|uniref:Uncharacterized protein n=1 Tax=Wenzhouxiangella marina TaxID=1579979 RepID=A0A0K0XXR9_9GAMM|nr:cyclase family protein [Wenzhouxiangella marina]AKS42494.1 hypothetical protein WM2015_2129 [Wenzhouxiangella marina]MBB6085731.1 kynurenine formamidase [Wenzhouxiangella marina]